MKKIIISILVVILFFADSNQIVYAADSSGNWVSEAFEAANSFIQEPTTDDTGIINPILAQFKNLIKGINVILLVLLAGLSAISLSVVGVRYLLSGASPHQRGEAQRSLRTVFIGMAYGFGAFLIWNIAMAIVKLIIGALAQ